MIKSPNYTQIPNEYLDHVMKTLNGSENLVFLVIMRKTLGWNKVKDKISYTQIVEKTGIGSYSTIKKALVSLEQKGLIIPEKVGKFISYEANIEITTETVDIKKENDYRNCSDTITETVAISEKITTETVDTKESSLNKSFKENLYTAIEKKYDETFKILYPDGKIIQDYARTRKRIKALLSKLTESEIIKVIDNAKNDDWIKSTGFSFSTILTDFQINKLLNGSAIKQGFSKPIRDLSNGYTLPDNMDSLPGGM